MSTTAAPETPATSTTTQTANTNSQADMGGGVKIAGRYETPDKFADGYKQLYKEVTGIDWKGEVFGKDTPNADLPSAETSYKQLRRAISGRGKEEAKGEAKPDAKPETKAAPAPAFGIGAKPQDAAPGADEDYDGDALFKELGKSWDDLRKEAEENSGDLSEDSYKKIIEKRGNLRKSDVRMLGRLMFQRDQYREAAQKLTTEKVSREAAEMVGGKDKLDLLVKWGQESLPEKQWSEIARRANDLDLWPGAIRELQAEYVAKHGSESTAARATAPASTNTSGFTSLAEFKAASDRMASGNAQPGDVARMKNTNMLALTRA